MLKFNIEPGTSREQTNIVFFVVVVDIAVTVLHFFFGLRTARGCSPSTAERLVQPTSPFHQSKVYDTRTEGGVVAYVLFFVVVVMDGCFIHVLNSGRTAFYVFLWTRRPVS